MPKLPPDGLDGLYHVIIPLDALETEPFDEAAVSMRPVSEDEAARLIQLFRNISRNQPCPCGSGVKFKKCCLRNAH